MKVLDALKELYENRMTKTSVDLFRRMQEFRLREDDDVCFHFVKLDDMCGQLSAMGKDIDNKEYTSILLASLPPCYLSIISGVTTALAQTTGQPTKPQLVIDPIMDEYDRLKIAKDKCNISPEEALATRHRKKKRSKPRCYKCCHGLPRLLHFSFLFRLSHIVSVRDSGPLCPLLLTYRWTALAFSRDFHTLPSASLSFRDLLWSSPTFW